MQRVTLTGAILRDFPEDIASGYLKLLFGGSLKPANSLAQRIVRKLKRDWPVLRSYTIRRFDTSRNEIDVDFVVHEGAGPASKWATTAKAGDEIEFLGPGSKKIVDMSADWCLLVGDMSALPAIAANVEVMPRDTRGYVVVEIVQEADRQELAAPPGLEVHWVLRPDAHSADSRLLETIKMLPWLQGEAGVWLAGELSAVRQIKQYFKDVRHVESKRMYASSYWQFGSTDEQHRANK
jgi:NADPH-dependent ferric siderophore reductase